jgi:hypothetical protein
MSDTISMPHLSIGGSEERQVRTRRLLYAFDAMSAVVRVLWPGDAMIRDPEAVRWNGAVLSLHEAEGHLYVAWKDEDHWDKFVRVVELAWNAAGFESGRVIHENADQNGLALLQSETMY